MGNNKRTLLILIMVAILAVSACGLIFSACAETGVTVTFDANGGTFRGGTSTITVPDIAAGTKVDLSLYAPVRDGYVLEGWVDDDENEYLDGEYKVPSNKKSVTLKALWKDQNKKVTAYQALKAVVNGLTSGDKIHSKYSTTVTVPGDSGNEVYDIEYVSNITRAPVEGQDMIYDIGFVIRKDGKGVMGIYMAEVEGAPGGLYIDTNPDDPEGSSVFYFEDIDKNLLNMVEKLPSELAQKINDLVGGLTGGMFSNVLELVVNTLATATAETAGGITTYSFNFNPTVINSLGGMVGSLLEQFVDVVNLNALFTYLEDVLPNSNFNITAKVDSSGKLVGLGSKFENYDTGVTDYDIATAEIVDAAEGETLVPDKVKNYAATYSFGHMQMSASLDLSTKGASGGTIDVGQLVNMFVPGTLPAGLITLDADVEYRLDASVDLDIKGENPDVDKNVIALEIVDVQNDKIVAGVYYKDGYIYVNIGSIVNGLTGVSDLWNGKGLKIEFALNDLLKAVKEKLVTLIDSLLGTEDAAVQSGGINAQAGGVYGATFAADGNVYISTGWADFISMVLSVLKVEGSNQYVQVIEGVDSDTLQINISKALIDEIMSNLGVGGVSIPDFGQAAVSVTVGRNGLENIGIGTNLNGLEANIGLSGFTFIKPIYVGDEETKQEISDYVATKVNEVEYTGNLNSLITSTLASGVKGSVDLQVNFNKGKYNVGKLLSMFGLDFGDMNIEVEQNAELDLSLNLGANLNTDDLSKSSLYLEFFANKDFNISAEGSEAIIKGGQNIIGIYIYNNDTYIDLSGLSVLGITLPVYKVSDIDVPTMLFTVLQKISDSNIKIDVDSLIKTIQGTANEEEAVQAINAMADGDGNVSSSTQIPTADLVNIFANNSTLELTVTLGAVMALLDTLNVGTSFDPDEYLNGITALNLKVEGGKLSVDINGELLKPEDGGNSDLHIGLSVDMNNDWSIGGAGLADEINNRVRDSVSAYSDNNDQILAGLINSIFNSTAEIKLTIKDGEVGIINLVKQILTIAGLDVDMSGIDFDVVLDTDLMDVTLRLELYSKDNGQAIKVSLERDASSGKETLLSVLLGNDDSLYIDLSYFSMGKYAVKDIGLLEMINEQLSALVQNLTIGGLLGGLLDMSGDMNAAAYINNKDDKEVLLTWNRYGAADGIYYKVYGQTSSVQNGNTVWTNSGDPLFDGTTDSEYFANGKFRVPVAYFGRYFIEVYAKKDAQNIVMFNTTVQPSVFDISASAHYDTDPAQTNLSWSAAGVKDGYKFTVTAVTADGEADLFGQLDMTSALFDSSAYMFNAAVDSTGVTKYIIKLLDVSGSEVNKWEVMPVKTGQEVDPTGTISVAINESVNGATWTAFEGAVRYGVVFKSNDKNSDGSDNILWSTTVLDNGSAYKSISWAGVYNNFTIVVTAYDAEGNVIAEGSATSAADNSTIDLIGNILSALSIKGNLINLSLSREIIAEVLGTLTGKTIDILEVNITDLDIFNGKGTISVNIYDSSSQQADYLGLKLGLNLYDTAAMPSVDTAGYTELNLLYGAGVAESIENVLSNGIAVDVNASLSFNRGTYNVGEVLSSFLPEDIASYIGDNLTWKVGDIENAKDVKIDINLSVVAIMNSADPAASRFMVSIGFPEGLTLGGDGDMVIDKGANIAIIAENGKLSVDLSKIRLLGIQMPKYQSDKFDMGSFIDGYMVQLQKTIGNLYNDGKGMVVDYDATGVTTDAEGNGATLNVAFDYLIGSKDDAEPFTFYYGTKNAEGTYTESPAAGATLVTGKPGSHTVTYKIADVNSVKDGDYFAVYAMDSRGHRYDAFKLYAVRVDGKLEFLPEIANTGVTVKDGEGSVEFGLSWQFEGAAGYKYVYEVFDSETSVYVKKAEGALEISAQNNVISSSVTVADADLANGRIVVSAVDNAGNAYRSFVVDVTMNEDGSVSAGISGSSVQAASFAPAGESQNIIKVSENALEAVISSQAVFSLLQAVGFIDAVPDIDFDITLGFGKNGEDVMHSIWLNVAGGFVNDDQGVPADLNLSLDAKFEIGEKGEDGNSSLNERIDKVYQDMQMDEASEYPHKLIEGIIDEVLQSKLNLSIDLLSENVDVMTIVKQFVGGMVDLGDVSLEVINAYGKPVSLDMELSMDASMADLANLKLALKLNYTYADSDSTNKTVLLAGIYVYNGSLYLDLSGIGVGAVEIKAVDVVGKLTAYLNDLIGKIDINFDDILSNTYPAFAGAGVDKVSTDEPADGATSGGMNVIKPILSLVSMDRHIIMLNIGNSIINELLSMAGSAAIVIDASGTGYVDVFNGVAEVTLTIKDGTLTGENEDKLILTAGLGLTANDTAAMTAEFEALLGKLTDGQWQDGTLNTVDIDLADIYGSAVSLLNSLDLNLNFRLETAQKGTVNLWDVLGPVLDAFVPMNNQTVIDVFNALREKGVKWEIDPTDIDLDLSVAADLVRAVDSEGHNTDAIDVAKSTLVVGITANKSLKLGNQSSDEALLDAGQSIYVAIYNGELFIDLSAVRVLGMQLPILRGGNLEVMQYLDYYVGFVRDKLNEITDKLTPAAPGSGSAKGVNAVALADNMLELGGDITLSIALEAITSILKTAGIADLTALDMPWDVVVTTGTDKGGQLGIKLVNRNFIDGGEPGSVAGQIGLAAALELKANVSKTESARHSELIKFVRGEGGVAPVDVRFAEASGKLIESVLNSVLNTNIVVDLSARSEAADGKFNIRYMLDGLLKSLGMQGFDEDTSDYEYILDASGNTDYRLNINLSGSIDKLDELMAMLVFQMRTNGGEWETIIGLYAKYDPIEGNKLYLDTSAIKGGAFGGGVIEVKNSNLLEFVQQMLQQFLADKEIDLDNMLNLEYDPAKVSGAPAISINPIDPGKLIGSVLDIVCLRNMGVILDADAEFINDLMTQIFNMSVDFVDMEGALYLVNGELDVVIRTGEASLTGGADVETYDVNAHININRTDSSLLESTLESIKATSVIDLQNGSTLAESIVDMMSRMEFEMGVELNLPGGLFGIGDLLNNFGLNITDANGLDLIFDSAQQPDSVLGGMQLAVTLSVKLSLDYDNPENTLAMLRISFPKDIVMGMDGGKENVMFPAGSDFAAIYISGSDLYVDLSSVRLLGIQLPNYHTSDFAIGEFVNYLLTTALENTVSTVYGDIVVASEATTVTTEEGTQVAATKFFWEPVDGAVSYKVTLPGGDTVTIKETEYTVANSSLPAEGIFELTVQPMTLNSNGEEVPMGTKKGVYTNTFDLHYVAEDGDKTTFTWIRSKGATHYAVSVNEGEPVYTEELRYTVNNSGFTSIRVTPVAMQEDGSYLRVGMTYGYLTKSAVIASGAPSDADALGGNLTLNEVMLIGLTENDINMSVSLAAVEALLNAIGQGASLGQYEAQVDLKISRVDEWMTVQFEGTLDENMYGENAKTSGKISLESIALGGDAADFRTQLLAEMNLQEQEEKAENAGYMIIQGIVDQVLNMSLSVDVEVGTTANRGDTSYMNIANIVNYIVSQIDGVNIDLGDMVMLNIEGMKLRLEINLGINRDDYGKSVISVTAGDATGLSEGEKAEPLFGLYMYGYDTVIDLSGISLGRYVVSESTINTMVYGIIDDLIKTIESIDINLNELVDQLYNMFDDSLVKEGETDQVSNVNVDKLVVGGAPSANGLEVKVTSDPEAGTTTFSWEHYHGASAYAIELYSGYDRTHANLVSVLNPSVVDGLITDNSITFNTADLNEIGRIADAVSKFNGTEYPSFYFFTVRAGRVAGDEFIAYTLNGEDVYGSYTNFSVLKTILGMVKIKNGDIWFDARAVMVNKLLSGLMGVNFDWADASIDAQLLNGEMNLEINVSDGDPEEYVNDWNVAAASDTVLNYTWTAVEGAKGYVFELRLENGDTVNIVTLDDELSVADGVVTAAVNLSENVWIDKDVALAKGYVVRIKSLFDVNSVNISASAKIEENGAQKAVDAMKDNGIVVNAASGGQPEDLQINPDIDVINLWSGTTLKDFLYEFMGGVQLEAGMSVYIAAGSYDLGALIGGLLDKIGVTLDGFDEIGSLVWTLTDNLVFNLELKLMMSLGATAEDTKIAFTIETDGLDFKDAEGNKIGVINPGVMIGLYADGKDVFIDLSNLMLVGLQMPCYTLSLDIYDIVTGVVDGLLDEVNFSLMGNKLAVDATAGTVSWKGLAGASTYAAEFYVPEKDASGNVTGWKLSSTVEEYTVTDSTYSVNVPANAGDTFKVVILAKDADGAVIARAVTEYTAKADDVQNQNMADGEGATELSVADAIVLGLSSHDLALSASFKAVVTLLNSLLAGNTTIATVSDILSMFDMTAGVTMTKGDNLVLTLNGDLYRTEAYPATEQTVNAKNVRLIQSESADNALVYEFTPVATADNYELVIKQGDEILGKASGSTTKLTVRPEAGKSLIVTDAATGKYTVEVTAKISNPVNAEINLGTNKLLGVDRDQVRSDIENTLAQVDVAGKMSEYSDKLISGLMDRLFNVRLSLMLDFTKQSYGFSLSELITSMIGDLTMSAGLSMGDLLKALDLNVSVDKSAVGIDIALNMNLEKPEESDIFVEISTVMSGVKDILLGMYVYDNVITVDLRAIGLRAYTINDLEYIVLLQQQLADALAGVLVDADGNSIDYSLSELINGLLNPSTEGASGEETTGGDVMADAPVDDKGNELPGIGIKAVNDSKAMTTTLSWDEVSGAHEYIVKLVWADGSEQQLEAVEAEGGRRQVTYSIAEGGKYNDVYTVEVTANNRSGAAIAFGSRKLNAEIASILKALSLQNSIISLDFTPQLLNNILSCLIPSVKINTQPLDINATVDIFNGDAEAEIDLTVVQDNGEGTQQELNLAITLGLGMAETLYERTSGGVNPDTPISKAIAAIGNDVETVDMGAYDPDSVSTNAARITKAILDALNTTQFTATINASFDKGAYDIAQTLASFGLDILDGVELLWYFDEPMDVQLSLIISAYIGSANEGTYFMVDLVPDKDIVLGDMVINGEGVNGKYTFKAGKSILSVYGADDETTGQSSVYLDLSGIQLLGLSLPVIKAEYSLADMLINEVYDIAAGIMDISTVKVSYTVEPESGNVKFEWAKSDFGSESVYYDVTVKNGDAVIASATRATDNFIVVSKSDLNDVDEVTVSVEAYYEYRASSGTLKRSLASGTNMISFKANANEAVVMTADDVLAENPELEEVKNVRFTYTGISEGTVTWDAYEGAVGYEIEIFGASTKETIPGMYFRVNGDVTSQKVNWYKQVSSAFDMFTTDSLRINNVGGDTVDYGFVVVVRAYVSADGLSDEGSTVFNPDESVLVAIGATDTYQSMSTYFSPANAMGKGYYNVGWGKVEGATHYTVLPYYVKESITDGMVMTSYVSIGKTGAEGAALVKDNLIFDASVGYMSFYNVEYSRSYLIEICAYDQFGNLIGYRLATNETGKLTDDSSEELLPMSEIAIYSTAENLAARVELGAVLGILKAVGVDLPVDLSTLDLTLSLGIQMAVGATGETNNIVVDSADTESFTIQNLTAGNYNVKVTFTNPGGVEEVTESAITSAGGDYVFNYSMRRLGDYKMEVKSEAGAVIASGTFKSQRLLGVSVEGDIFRKADGTLTVTNETGNNIAVTDDGKIIFWDPVAGAQTYSLDITKYTSKDDLTVEKHGVFENLSGTLQQVNFSHVGYYKVIVVGYDAEGLEKGLYTAYVEVTGESGLNMTIGLPYESMNVGDNSSEMLEAVKKSINDKISASDAAKNNYEVLVDMVKAYLADFHVTLDLDLNSLDNQLNLTKLINSILSAVGSDLEIGAPIYLNTDYIEELGVQLNVEWHMDFVTALSTYATVELIYRDGPTTKTLLGVYLSKGTFYADLSGLGFFGVALESLDMNRFLLNTIEGVIDGLFAGLGENLGEGLNFSDAIKMLLGEYPTIDLGVLVGGGKNEVNVTDKENTVTETSMATPDDATTPDTAAAETESEEISSDNLSAVIGAVLNAVSIKSTNILVSATTAILDEITSKLLGIKLGIDIDMQLEVPLLAGDITASLRLDNVQLDGRLSISTKTSAPVINASDYAVMSASAGGRAMVEKLLRSIPLNLTLTLANANQDTATYQGNNESVHTSPASLKLTVETVRTTKTFSNNLKTAFTANPGDIVVMISGVNYAEYNTSGAGGSSGNIPMAYVHINNAAGKLSVRLAQNWFRIVASVIGIDVEVDLGYGIKGAFSFISTPLPLAIDIDLDLLSTLGTLFDGLLETLYGTPAGEEGGNASGSAEVAASSGTGETVEDYNVRIEKPEGGAADDRTKGAIIKWNKVMQPAAEGAEPVEYDKYNVVITRSDGSVVESTEVTANGSAEYSYTMENTYYTSFKVTVSGAVNPTGLGKVFAELDIWSLLGGAKDMNGNYTGGIFVNVSSTAEMSLNIKFDPYTLNKLIDDVMGSIVGADSILDLSSIFSNNYFQYMWWDRVSYSPNRLFTRGSGGDENPVSTLDSLNANLKPMIADLLDMLNISINEAGGIVNVTPEAIRANNATLDWGSSFEYLLRVFMYIMPFAIWNEASLNVNLVNGMLTNIAFHGQDTGDAVLRYNEETGQNEVYVYYAKTLYQNSNGGYYTPDGYGNFRYNPNGKTIGYDSGETVTVKYYTDKAHTVAKEQTVKVYTYAIPYGSTDSSSPYYYQNVAVKAGTGAGGGATGFGGANYARTGTVLPNFNGNNQTINNFTSIDIYNSIENVHAVGNPNEGVVSWGNITDYIVYDPLKMGDANTAAKIIMDTYFPAGTQFVARYQKGATYARANVTFTTDAGGGTVLTSGNLADILSRLADGASATIYAQAPFTNGVAAQRLDITVTRLDSVNEGGAEAIKSVDSWKMHYYDEMPEYVIVTTTNGKRKRYSVTTDSAKRDQYDAVISGFEFTAESYAQASTVNATLTFRNGTTKQFEIEYLDSTLNNPTVEIDLYKLYDIGDVAAQIEGITMTYYDGATLVNDSAITFGAGGSGLTRDTVITSAKHPQCGTLGAWIDYMNSQPDAIEGDTVIINAVVAPETRYVSGGASNVGKFTQSDILVTIDIASKMPKSVSVRGGENNTVTLNPYDYYMYLVTGNDAYNPLPAIINVNYDNGKSETVNVMWLNAADEVITADEYVSKWYTKTSKDTFYLENDESRYGNFRWTDYAVSAQINNGVISKIEFYDAAAGYVQYVSKDKLPATARVTFAGGYVIDNLPVAFVLTKDGNKAYAYIGFNTQVYASTGAIVDYDGFEYKQSKLVEVK